MADYSELQMDLDVMDEDLLRGELLRSKKAEKRLTRELDSSKRMLQAAADGDSGGGLIGLLRSEIEATAAELADFQTSSEAELAEKVK